MKYFERFNAIESKYLPLSGEGTTRATQIVTAVTKLVYKWFNDGDVFDNTYCLSGWCNDLSCYANWLSNHYEAANNILVQIEDVRSEEEYEALLQNLADQMFNEDFLEAENKKALVGSIYNERGQFNFVESYEDEDEEY